MYNVGFLLPSLLAGPMVVPALLTSYLLKNKKKSAEINRENNTLNTSTEEPIKSTYSSSTLDNENLACSGKVIYDGTTVSFEKAEMRIFSNLSWEGIEIGEPIETEEIIRELLTCYSSKSVSDWLYNLFLNNTDNRLFVYSILHAISHVEYERLYPFAPVLAMASFTLNDNRAVSLGMKAFSNWNAKHSLKYIKNISPKETWAKEDWENIVNYIKEYGDEIDGLPNENDRSSNVDTMLA